MGLEAGGGLLGQLIGGAVAAPLEDSMYKDCMRELGYLGRTDVPSGGSPVTTEKTLPGLHAQHQLLAMPPDEQAKILTKGIKGCEGESPFAMGVIKSYAYWSVRCKDGRSFVVQIAPDAKATAADCRALDGTGKECFTKL
jgi:hypothetical protein